MIISNKSKNLISKIIANIDTFIAVYALVSFLALIGFYLDDWWYNFYGYSTNVILSIFISSRVFLFYVSNDKVEYFKSNWFENLISIFMLTHLMFGIIDEELLQIFFPELNYKQLSIIYLAVIHIFLIFSNIVILLRYNHLIAKIKIHPGAIFSLSFLFIILTGTFLLMMPRATFLETRLTFLDALFTSTSAVCVTGLIVQDTATTFTPLGKLIILFLIQVGGLGIMSITSLFAALLAGGLSIKARMLMKEALSSLNINDIKTLILKIILYTLVIELIGAIILYFSSDGTLVNFDLELFYSAIFHSVSAFCNAGFSLYSNGLMNQKLQGFSYMYTISFLIILGGIGFNVLLDITNLINPYSKKRPIGHSLNISTKIVLISTFILIVGGTISFYFLDFFPLEPEYKIMTDTSSYNEFLKSKYNVAHAFFMSVTCRTAGFNTVPIEGLSAGGVLIAIFLMFIGASPGSTGGGIKTTTFFISFMSVINLILGKNRSEIFKKEIGRDSIIKSYKVIIASLFFAFFGTFILVIFEPDKNPLDLAFEAVSAMSTVGLSRNLTYFVGDGSKVVLILLMFIGRIGIINFITSFYTPKPESNYKLPVEEINVG